MERLSAPQLRLFVRRYEAFKAEQGLVDFVDLLERVLESEVRPPVSVAFIDEGHDLSPLQIAVVEMWFGPCERVYVCADDDQAIFRFQGAAPEWIRDLAARSDSEVLHQSYRVPIVVHALSQRIIAADRERLPKVYAPKNERGQVVELDLDQALARVDQAEDAFVLCRNRIFIRRVARALVDLGVPFVVEGWGGYSPMSDEAAVDAVRLALRLQQGEPGPFSTKDVGSMLSLVPVDSGLVSKSAKAAVNARKGRGSYTTVQLIDDLDLGTLLAAIEVDGPVAVLSKLDRASRRYFERLLLRYGELPGPHVTVTSIHAAKGREAQLVIVLPDMTRRTYREYVGGGQSGHVAESRVFYVAVTRTKDTLVLVQPKSRRYFVFPKVAIAEGDL